MVELPGRGRTYVVDVPGPDARGADRPAAARTRLHGGPDLVPRARRALEHLPRGRVRPALARARHPLAALPAADCADDVAALLDALGVDRRDRSRATRWAGHRPARLAPAPRAGRRSGAVLHRPQLPRRPPREVLLPDRSRGDAPAGPVRPGQGRAAAETCPRRRTWTPRPRALGKAEFRSTSAWSMPEVLGELGRFNSAPWIGEVDVPTAVVVTAKDHAIPAQRQHRLAGCIEGATVAELPGGHASLFLDAARRRRSSWRRSPAWSRGPTRGRASPSEARASRSATPRRTAAAGRRLRGRPGPCRRSGPRPSPGSSPGR